MAPDNKSNARQAAATPAGRPPDGVKKTRGRPRLPRDAKDNEQQAQQANVNAQDAGGFDVAQALKSLDAKLGAKITKVTGDVTRLSTALEKMLDNGMVQAEGAVLFEPHNKDLVHTSKLNTIKTRHACYIGARAWPKHEGGFGDSVRHG